MRLAPVNVFVQDGLGSPSDFRHRHPAILPAKTSEHTSKHNSPYEQKITFFLIGIE